MSIQNRHVLVPWLLCAVCVASVSIQVIIWAGALEGRPSLFDAVERLGWGFALPILFSVLAALILTRQPRNTVGWLMMIPALFIAIPSSPDLEAQLISPPANPEFALTAFAWLHNWSWIPVIFPIILLPLHFPNGQTPTPRWRIVDYLAIAMVGIFLVAVTVGMTLRPTVDGATYSLPNPVGFVPDQIVDALIGPWVFALLALVGSSVASLLVRYRNSGREVRQQIKWVLSACLLFAFYYAGNSSVQNFYQASNEAAPQALMNMLMVLFVLTIPAAIAIAILRHRLYDIDVIIRKTAVYATLTALLALVYFGSVLLLQNVFGTVAGQQSPAIIVISTLLIAALFAPARRRVQETLDRRFFRKKYDAQQVLEAFAQTARDETEIDILSAELARVVQETMQPQILSIWLNGRREKTSL